MKSKILTIVILLFISCESDLTNSDTLDFDKLYVTLQGTDKVVILNASTLEIIEEITIDLMEGMIGETPHYVALDEENGYWFVSAIMTNKIAMYSIDTNELIDAISVNEDPAILSINSALKKIYSSRMMIMNMGGMIMGSETNLVDEISYDSDGMTLIQSHDSGSPTPHALSLTDDGVILLTASNTTDFLSKINLISGEVSSISLDGDINDIPTFPINRLKPLEITDNGEYAFISCTGGEWQDPSSGQYEEVNGQVHAWNISTLEKISTYDFDVYSRPWHIDSHPYEDKIYIVLSGSSSTDNSAGLACLSFNGSSFSHEWTTTNSEFDTLHGIAISSDGAYVYVSGRGDGNIYKFDALTGLLINTINLISSGMTRTGGIAITQ